jgi:hypothetical protein
VENIFHKSGMDRFYLLTDPTRNVKAALREPLLKPAIGVIYCPETERESHYFYARVLE